MKPTQEQQAILDAFRTGAGLTIEAGAGSGKTSTLRMLAQGTRKRGIYIAYNASVRDDARDSFPRNVTAMTSHGLAYGPVATRYQQAGRQVNGARVPAQRTAEILRIREPVRIAEDKAPYAPQQLARLALAMVDGFCKSGDPEVGIRHLPRLDGLTPLEHKAVAEAVLPFARVAWADILDTRGLLRFEHNHYLKIFQLSQPRLTKDFLLVDEAQDLNPCVAAIVEAQTHMQVVFVGDRCQAINHWNGAIDAMENAPGQRLYLSQSFRFGGAIADEANKWLSILKSPMHLRGFDQIASRVEPLEAPDAILCRTNATAFGRVLEAASDGRRVALVGGGAELAKFARAAKDLKAGRPTDHPEWLAFSTWREVQAHVSQDETASDMRVLVKLIDAYGPDRILSIANGLVDERVADLIVSTAHKSKGREWPWVQIADDFREPLPVDHEGRRGRVRREDAMLAYVTVTRAKEVLDRSGLAWVDRWVSPRPRSLDDLIEASSLGTPDAVAAREQARVELTGMPEEQADWDEGAELADLEPLQGNEIRRRCTPETCRGLCDSVFPDRCMWPQPTPAGAR